MSAPPPELARLVAAHRVVNRPDPELQGRVRAAVDRDHRRGETRRWVGGGLVGAAVGLAAILLVRCVAISSSSVEGGPGDVDPHGAAHEQDDAVPSGGVAVPVTRDQAIERAPSRPEAETDTAPSLTPPSASVQRPNESPRTLVDPRPAAPRDESPGPGAATPTEGEREVRLLREAEVALKRDPGGAIAILTEHERTFPTTTMRVEREALTVLALCAAGRTIEGRGRRAAFLKTHASSAYAGRVRAACTGD